MVPDQPVTYKESEPKERQVTIDDWFLQAFHTSFVSGSHCYLLDDLDNVMPVDKKKKKVVNTKAQAMDSRLAALFEI